MTGADPPSHFATQSEEAGRGGAVKASPDADRDVAAQLDLAGFPDAQEIGRGGFGVVYRCAQAGLARSVAVKVLTEGFAENRARFLREQEAMGRLTGHPNIVAVLQVGKTADGALFLVMPYCAGGCWQGRIARLGVLELDEVLRVGVKIAGALESAHRVGVIHRDVKPDNILLTEFGEPTLSDFGIARTAWGGFQTGTGMLLGSPAYIAPEILTGTAPSAATDVYGLGASLFAGLTGHAAFERRSGEEVVAQYLRVTTEPVPDLRNAGVPDEVATVVERAMARDAAERPSAVELGRSIQRIQAGLGLAVSDMAVYGAEPQRFPSVRWAAPAPSLRAGRVPQLPVGMVGRDDDVARLGELLTDSRLVTLIGMGGVGKTTLATHAAHEAQVQFADGVWWVELADLRDGALLVEFVAAAMGVRDQPGRPLLDVLTAFLRAREALVVFDNCEHIIGDVAKLVDALLRDCPQLRIVATSREVLEVGGESVMPLAPLAVPDSEGNQTLGSMSALAGVALFVARARAATPGFELTKQNAAAVGRICAQLDGLPLALELAASRLRAMSVDEIADGLADRYALLTHGRRGAPERQQTLSGCVGWSYGLCTTTEQLLWARLSVFAGSFDPAAAHAVCGGDLSAGVCRDVLSDLVDKSILVRSDSDGRVRFKLLEILREYGKARIEDSAEYPLLRRRHAQWCEGLLADADTHWYGPDQLAWVERLIGEMPNIREALRFSVAESPTDALKLTANMRRIWMFRGMLGEGRRWLDLALNAAPPEPSLPRLRSAFAMTQLAGAQGDFSQRWAAEAAELLKTVDDPTTRGLATAIGGFTALLGGDIEGARECCRQAVAATDDREAHVWSSNVMGLSLVVSGEVDGALVWFEKATALAQACGDWELSQSLVTKAIGHWAKGDLQGARDLLRQGLQLAAPIHDAWTVAVGLETSAWVAVSSQDAQRAAVLMAAAAAVSRANGGAGAPFAHLGPFHGDCERHARAQLSAAEYERASGIGDSMTFGEAVAFALEG